MAKQEEKTELQRAVEVLTKAGVAVPEGKLPEVLAEVVTALARAQKKLSIINQVGSL